MSEETPETADAQAHEPSMEDILSSIRQMIDDDDIGVNVPDTADSEASASLEPTALVKAVDAPEAAPSAQVDEPVNPLDILESLTEDDSADDLEIPAISNALEELTVENVETSEAETVIAVDSDVETETALDDEVLILDEILEIEDDALEASSPLDYVGGDAPQSDDIDLVITDDLAEFSDPVDTKETTIELSADSSVSGETDIDLVKSLMANLTEDDLEEGDEVSESETLNAMVIDDEEEMVLPSGSAILAIAREASAEAEVAERNRRAEAPRVQSADVEQTNITSGEDNLEIWVVEMEDEETEQPEITAETTEFIETVEQETPDMPQAAETIIDNEIEADTSGAFASLAKVVQEKENNANLGPYVGELVTEALRPMLKEWLDKNLKGIVDRAVAKEIKRISGAK